MGDEAGVHQQTPNGLDATLALQNRALLTLLTRRNGQEAGEEEDGLDTGIGSAGSTVRNTRRREQYRRTMANQPGALGRQFAERMRTRLPTPAYATAQVTVPDPCLALERHGGWSGQETYGYLAWLTSMFPLCD